MRTGQVSVPKLHTTFVHFSPGTERGDLRLSIRHRRRRRRCEINIEIIRDGSAVSGRTCGIRGSTDRRGPLESLRIVYAAQPLFFTKCSTWPWAQASVRNWFGDGSPQHHQRHHWFGDVGRGSTKKSAKERAFASLLERMKAFGQERADNASDVVDGKCESLLFRRVARFSPEEG